MRRTTRATTPLGRWGTAEDVAKVRLFLASVDADFVSGVTIPVAGVLLGHDDVVDPADDVARKERSSR